MDRRRFLESLCASVAAGAGLPAPAASASSVDGAPAAPCRLAASWRGAAAGSPHRVGIVEIDWQRDLVHVLGACEVPGRAHGLTPEPGGGFLAVAFRHGAWLWRLDAHGQPVRRISLADEPGERRLCGHAIAGRDADVVLTTEFDVRTGEGWIGVRDRDSLRKLDEWRTHGSDPHQLLFDPDGHVVVANGGVLRTGDDRKRDLDRMDSSLVRLDARNGAMRGRWEVEDRRLSLRHVAWNTIPGLARPLLGIALQGEHDDPARRAQAPVLAVWDGEALRVPTHAAEGGGYGGDIAPAPGGFAISCQYAKRVLWWRHDRPAQLTTIARLHEACALSPSATEPGAVLVAAARGVGRWHPARPAAMLPWPEAMAMGSHWAALSAA